MKLSRTIVLAWLLTIFAQPSAMAAEDQVRIAELNQYWAEVARAVKAGDFAAYQATCHKEGVLVSGVKKLSEPLSAALTRWEKEFTATKSGQLKASVEFRFAQRLNDSTTAHELVFFIIRQSIRMVRKSTNIFTSRASGQARWQMENSDGLPKSKATVEGGRIGISCDSPRP